MTIAAYIAFVGLCALLSLTPGPDSLLVLRCSVRRATAGIAAALGCSVGTIVWAALVGIGLAALIEQSAEVFRVLKVIGGLYLLFLGIQAIRQSRTPAEARADDAPASADKKVDVVSRRGLTAAFAAGLLSTMTNPKVGLFYLAVVPQFLPRDGSVFATAMLLGLTLGVVSILYLATLASLAAKATVWLRKPRVTKYIERISGSILAALGIGTAASAFEA
ncbi:MAG: lysine transporter LysE [Glaciihabitans sp.]|nr:lysine transporter LysE [Glaciihabitans sp.]